jgi:hypothetical protein
MCSVNWALLINLIAALGSCGAAIVAVVIATSDRRQRNTERLDAAQAQAMLVLIDVELSQSSPGFYVYVTNFGAQAILGVEVDAAWFARVPDATFKVTNRVGPKLKVIDADRKRDTLVVEFVDGKGNSVITGQLDRLGTWRSDNAEPADLDVTIRFMDAHGHHWLRSLDSVKLAEALTRHR